jgi:glycosyltransferase involved in cell wall biosynthesis
MNIFTLSMKEKYEKLILLTSGFPYGKGENFLEKEIKILASKFKEVLIISCSPSSDESRETPENVHTIIFKSTKSRTFRTMISKSFLSEFLSNLFSNPLKNKVAINSWFIATELTIQIQEHITPNTILYSYWLDDKALALSILKSKNRMLKVVSRAHRWDIYEEEHLYHYLPFRKFLFKQLNAIYSISSDGLRYLESKGAMNVEISRLGTIQTEEINTQSSGEVLNLVSISYLIKRKRMALLIDALQVLDNEGVEIKWTHFGDGPEMDQLKERTESLQHISVTFKGFISNTLLMEWISANANSSVLINLSESEGIPVSMMEAMSYGIPCIGTNVGGVSEIIEDGKNGCLLPATPNKKGVADTLNDFYSLSVDDKTAMKKNAVKFWKMNYEAERNFNDFCQRLLKI